MTDDKTEDAFTAGRELSAKFFQEAEEFTPRIVDELMELRREYLRAWAEGIGSWLDFGEEITRKLNLEPKLSTDVKTMARDLTETWIKAEGEMITGAISVSRSLLRATAGGSRAINAAGFRAASATVDIVRPREREAESVTQDAAAEVGAA